MMKDTGFSHLGLEPSEFGRQTVPPCVGAMKPWQPGLTGTESDVARRGTLTWFDKRPHSPFHQVPCPMGRPNQFSPD
jgi:hypothetical protein